MAKDYKFVMHCWQDQYGDENATANIFVNDTQVATNVEISATSADSPNKLTFEATGLPNPALDGSVTADVKIVLTNEAYVDADNDRNIWIDGLYAFAKDPADADYKFLSEANYNANNRDASDFEPVTDASIADDSAIWSHLGIYPTNVQGSQILSTWWTDDGTGAWTYIPVWGDESNVGTTITLPLK